MIRITAISSFFSEFSLLACNLVCQFGLLEALSNILPVHDVEDGIDVVWSDIFVLKVVGMLPDINAKQGDQTWWKNITNQKQFFFFSLSAHNSFRFKTAFVNTFQ